MSNIPQRVSHKLLSTIRPSTTALLVACMGGMLALPAQASDIVVGFKAPRQTNEVAFVPFVGDSLISSVIMNDLNSTKLKVTKKGLPQQAHSSSEAMQVFERWQQLGIPYLVVGSTQSQGSKILIEYEVINVTSGRVVDGKQRLTSDSDPQSLRYAGHVIADKIYKLITGGEGDFSGKIAYIEEIGKDDNKVSQLKIMDADGQNIRSINRVKGSIFSPAWSPNGRTIAYAIQYPKGLPVIYLQNIDGGQPQRLTPFKGLNLNPSFSPDGNSILFSSSFQGNSDVYRISLGSNRLEKLVSMPSDEVEPSYAPDGRSFLFVSNKTGVKSPQIYRYNFDTKAIKRISRVASANSPSFSPDGTQIAFLNGRNASIMNLSGVITHNIGNTGIDEAPHFSPNGKRVVYATKKGNKGMIKIKSLEGGRSFGRSARGIVRYPVWSKGSN